jgi:hypothetical protein
VHPYAHPFVRGGARFEGHAYDHGGYHGHDHDYHR